VTPPTKRRHENRDGSLLAKYGTKRAAITIAKVIPFVGGIVGGGVDAALTGVVGAVAKKAFPQLL
jgi:4-diphosphocytidyl-2C-methyl-D-erythritol kinase